MAEVETSNQNTSTTLFVGNLPYGTSQTELEEPFSNIGPIQRCFVVSNKGVGYVKFALREDAELAIKKVIRIGGRIINLKFAKKRSENIEKEAVKIENECNVKNEKKTKPNVKTKHPKDAKLIIRNISFKANEKSIKKVFQQFGKIVEVIIPKKNDGKMKGFCFIQYEKLSAANHALQKMNGTEFLNRPIAVDWSVPRKKYFEIQIEEKELTDCDSESEKMENVEDNGDDSIKDDDEKSAVKPKKVVKDKNIFSKEDDVVDYVESEDESNEGSEETESDGSEGENQSDDSEEENKSDDSEEEDEDESDHSEEDESNESEDDDESEVMVKKMEKPTDASEGKTLFIRNLSFNTTKGTLADTFSKFGKLYYADICVNKETKCSQGRGFVKFINKKDAMKCLKAAKQQPAEESVDGIETGGIVLDGQVLLVSLAITREELRKQAKDKVKKVEKKEEKSSDVSEEKTLFIQNLSFSTTKETLADTFSKFGELHYAVVCVNKETEYPQGTGFVKFKNKEDAMKCLEAAKRQQAKEYGDGIETGGIMLDEQVLFVSLALAREDLQKQADNKKKKPKDNRNLYLAREGLIRPGTQAAEGVSKQDLDKRVQLEVWKQRMLTNYNIFVAKDRLCIRNLPQNMTDARLRKIFLNAGGPGAEVTEARVMKDFRILTAKGNPSGKGYGFVKFTTHEHALKALRNTNNNPHIFTNNLRPIVEFSLENKAALNAKMKRLLKSQQCNRADSNPQQATQKPRNDDRKNGLWRYREGRRGGGNERFDEQGQSFSGVKADANTKKFPSHLGPKIRHKKRNQTVKAKGKISRRKLQKDSQHVKMNRNWEKNSNGIKGVRSPKKKARMTGDRSDAKFDSMVTKHKRNQNQESVTNTSRKRKWFHRD